jgi:hypothetical protein
MYVIFEMFKQDLNQSKSKFSTLKQTFPIQLLESIILWELPHSLQLGP